MTQMGTDKEPYPQINADITPPTGIGMIPQAVSLRVLAPNDDVVTPTGLQWGVALLQR